MICSSVIIVSILALAIFWFTQLVLTSANDTTNDPEITPEYQDSQNGPDLSQIYVSHSSGYYETAIKLEMYPPEGYDIYYTVTMSAARSLTDGRYAPTGESYFFIGGKDPDPSKLDTEEREEYGNSLFNSSEGRMRTYKYSKPLDFVNTSTFASQVITVKAALFKDNVQQCPVRHFTYILGSITGDKSYEDIYGSMLISITIDDELLYDYERGIFISGKKYDEAMEKGVAIDPWTPRNYNQRGTDWERLAHVDFFEEDGTLVLSQVCGVRVAGGTSRGAQYKSLKLVAGPQYDGNERFNYRFFEGAKDVNGENITSFKKLVLRNPRNDIGGTMIRDQLLHKLGGDVGVDYQEGRNAVVYLNGKYYSIMCLHESLDADFMEDHYFVNKNNVASFLIRSDQYLFRYKQENGTDEQFKCFLSDMNYLIYNDFSGTDGLQKIREVIDVENFCRYMAYQLFIVNLDWPHNNVLVWRYYGPENSSVTGMDGRWRFVLKDLDFGLNDPETDTFSRTLNDGLYGNEPCLGPVLRNLLKNRAFTLIFRQCCYQVTEVLNEDYLIERINQEVDELSLDMEIYSLYNGIGIDGWKAYFDQWRDFARRRKDYFLKYVDHYAPV